MKAEQWAVALDREMRERGVSAGELVSEAFADGSAAGVPVACDRDDDHGRALVSADYRMAVRFQEQTHWWTAVDPVDVSAGA